MEKSEMLKALQKKAEGYECVEQVSEYGINDGEEVLLKRKVKVVSVPADLAAMKYLSEIQQDDLEGLSEAELKALKKRLLKELKEQS